MVESIRDRILNAIRQSGIIDEKRFEKMIEKAQKEKGGAVVTMLLDSEIVAPSDLMRILSQELGMPPLDLSRLALDPKTVGLVPEKLIRRYTVMPLSKIGKNLSLVMFDPTDIIAIDDVKSVTGCNIDVVLATHENLQNAINNFFQSEDKEISTIMEEREGDRSDEDVIVMSEEEELDVSEITKESNAAPIVKIVGLIINEAIKSRASDIHIEPQEKSVRIRYRIDGELHEVYQLPKKNQKAILARLKIMSNMDITENRVPQDGRFRIKTADKEIDFRVSALPINYGNKMVLRALDKSNLSVGLETLGFLPGPLSDFKAALARPFGIILVTGPTGSGKSTTLYSILNEMNVPERSIITVEDPVEYQVPGITQIAAKPEIGLDFASGLRAILRQSPDVIMVGEIRDFETADIAIKASLTGQMVLSTLHTNDAVGAITRLVNMGIEPFLVASSLILTCAQRLLRRICPHCKVEADIPKDKIKKIQDEYPEAKKVEVFYMGRGCKSCNNTGYRGRLGTLETVLVDDEIREMINKRKPEGEIKEYLDSKGVKNLRDNAMMKFIKGMTTLEEVYRVT